MANIFKSGQEPDIAAMDANTDWPRAAGNMAGSALGQVVAATPSYPPAQVHVGTVQVKKLADGFVVEITINGQTRAYIAQNWPEVTEKITAGFVEARLEKK